MLKLNKVLNSVKPEASAAAWPDDIYPTLEKLRQSHSLIYVARGNGNDRLNRHSNRNVGQSIILRLDRLAATLTIDELFPQRLVLEQDERVCVTIRRPDNRSITFHTRVIERSSDADNPGYTLALPTHLDDHQRRGAFRLATSGRAHWQRDETNMEQASITDISISGVQLALPASTPEPALGDAIENCQLQLAALKFSCDLRVARIISSEAGSGTTTIGAQIVTLDSQRRRKLERFIMQEQRQQRLRSAS